MCTAVNHNGSVADCNKRDDSMGGRTRSRNPPLQASSKACTNSPFPVCIFQIFSSRPAVFLSLPSPQSRGGGRTRTRARCRLYAPNSVGNPLVPTPISRNSCIKPSSVRRQFPEIRNSIQQLRISDYHGARDGGRPVACHACVALMTPIAYRSILCFSRTAWCKSCASGRLQPCYRFWRRTIRRGEGTLAGSAQIHVASMSQCL